MIDELPFRLEHLLSRLRSAYDGIGHSSGRPYVYFVYPPQHERATQRLITETLRTDDGLCFHHIDLLPLTITTLQGQEERRRDLLQDPRSPSAAADILRQWTRVLIRNITTSLQAPASSGRPVIVLSGLAALYPLGNPTALMEQIAEQEPRDPQTNRIIPIVLLVPGTRPVQTSRQYRFLGLDRYTLEFYRGEEL